MNLKKTILNKSYVKDNNDSNLRGTLYFLKKVPVFSLWETKGTLFDNFCPA